MILHICYATDNNFCMQTAVSICSLFQNKGDFSLDIHLLDAGISDENYEKLSLLCQQTDVRLFRYDINPLLEQVVRTGQKCWGDFPSHATWARLFLPEILPDNIDRVLYLDGDVIAAGPFHSLFDLKLENQIIAAAEDCVPHTHKRKIGLLPETRYINAGVILFDLSRWRRCYMADWPQKYLVDSIRYPMADQDVINLMFEGMCHYLPLRYNYTSWFRALNPTPLKRLMQDEQVFRYSDSEIMECKKQAVFVHYNSCSLLIRPWYQNATDPATSIWRKYQQNGLCSFPLLMEPEHLSPSEQKDRSLYQTFGKHLFGPVHQIRSMLISFIQ